MKTGRFGRFVRMVGYFGLLFGFAWLSLADAGDVYNLYFQKGAAPQSVVQSGAGQSTAPNGPIRTVAKPISDDEEDGDVVTNVAPAAAATNVSSTELSSKDKTKDYLPYAISVGYGRNSDPIGWGMTYGIGFQYNFNRYVAARLQGRFRDLQTGRSNYSLADREEAANRLGGLLAVAVTPLRMNLMGHKFMDFSAYTGVETYRRLSEMGGVGQYHVATAYAPTIGATAMLGLNENVGIELQASRSTNSTYVGANLAFQF